MTVEICGFTIELNRKRIKNLYIYVKPPDGRIVISAPKAMKLKDIERFVNERHDWLISQRKKFEGYIPPESCEYITGEKIRLFGDDYSLRVTENSKKNSAFLNGNEIVLDLRAGVSREKRAQIIEAFKREEFKKLITERLPIIENMTGLKCSGWHIRTMKTRWGSCNTVSGNILFNSQLYEKTVDCIDYLILHEIIHLRVPNHGAEFKKQMDKYMPDWREKLKKLNLL